MYLINVINAHIKKGFIIIWRYKVTSVWLWFTPIFLFITFDIMTRYLPNRVFTVKMGTYELSYFHFLITGIVFSLYPFQIISRLTKDIEIEKRGGTLEMFLMAPTSFVTIIIAMYTWAFLFSLIGIIPYIVIALFIVKVTVTINMLIPSTVIFLFTIILFCAIAMFTVSFVLLFEKGEGFVNTMNNVMRLFGGIAIPLNYFPDFIQRICAYLPITPALKAFRQIIFMNHTISNVFPEIKFLIIYSLILWPLGILILNYALKRIKIKNTVTRY